MKKSLTLMIWVFLFCANHAIGANINYSYVELGYVELELDDVDVEGDGYELNASFGLSQTVAVIAGYQDLDLDRRVEGSEQSLGLLYHKPYSTTGDLVLGLSLLELELDPPTGETFDESGNEFIIEIRSRSGADSEYTLGLARREIDGDSDSGYNFGIVSGSPQGFQFVLDYTDTSDTKSITLGLRSGF